MISCRVSSPLRTLPLSVKLIQHRLIKGLGSIPMPDRNRYCDCANGSRIAH
jgi:hypothetical protein